MRIKASRRRGYLISAVVLVLAYVFGVVALTAAEAPDIDRTVSSNARKVMRKYGIPGMSIALTVDGQTRFYNFGVASKDTRNNVTSDTLYEIGSISKTLTATLVTLAQAEGRLSLADHPGKFIPELQGTAFDRLTLLHLGTHTTGGFPLQLPGNVRDVSGLMDYLAAWQPMFVPGTHRTYANPGIGTLGMIAARSLHMSFNDAMEKRLFAKLGMRSSYIDVPESRMSLYAQGYDRNDVPVRIAPAVLADEAYGVKTSAKDLIRFVQVSMDTGSLDPEAGAAVRDTHNEYFRVGPMTQALAWEHYPYPVGLHVLIEGNSNDMAMYSHVATEIIPYAPPKDATWINKTGSTNGFAAYVAFVPETRTGIVILANKNYPNEARVRLAYAVFETLQEIGNTAVFGMPVTYPRDTDES